MTTTPAPVPSAMDRFFTTLHRSPVVRSTTGTFGGVCAGLADHLGVSTRIVRLVAVVSLVAGIGLPLYLLAWLMLPDAAGRVHLERALRGGGRSSIVLLVATALAVLPIGHDHEAAGDVAGLAWVALLAVLIVAFVRRNRTQDA